MAHTTHRNYQRWIVAAPDRRQRAQLRHLAPAAPGRRSRGNAERVILVGKVWNKTVAVLLRDRPLLDQHPSGRTALMVRVPSGRRVRVKTAEGKKFPLPRATDGPVVELKTKRAWDTKVLVTLPDNREHQLPLPVGALIWVS